MKILTRYLALAAIAVILGSCSFAIGALNHRKSRVVASAIWHGRTTAPATRTARSAIAAGTLSPPVAKRRVLPPRPASSVARSSRSAAHVAPRDISASTDIDYITYTIMNLNPGSGGPDIQDYLDPYYPYIDVFLTPGQNYRITVDVALLSTSSLAANTVGITGYGDSADVAVPADGSDVWVDMTIHAEGTVFNNQVVSGNVTYRDPVAGGSTTKSLGLGTPTLSPHDQFFYTSDSLLYYFNFAGGSGAGSVTKLTDITATPVTTAAAFIGTGASATFRIYAICPDPGYAGWFYVVGFNSLGSTWDLYVVNYDPPGVPTADWTSYGPPLDITADVEAQPGGGSAPAVVTGVAADLYGDVNVTFYNTAGAGNGTPVSGLIQYYFGSFYTQYVPDTTVAWTSANSIFTDVMCSGSTVYVLGSPNTSVGGIGNSTGTADVYIFDFYFNQLSANPSPVARTYSGSVPSLTGGSSLILPNKFVGMLQGGSFFLSQIDFAGAGGTDYLSAVSADLSSATSVP